MKITHVAAATALVLGLGGAGAFAQSGGGWNSGGGEFDPVPDGSYQRSCRDITVQNGRLYARCRDRYRGFTNAEIDVRSCGNGRIENVDGRLRCSGWTGGGGGPGGPGGGGGWPGGPGGGGWNGGGNGPVGLIVFENPDYKGSSLQIRGSVPDMYGSGLDDMITSVRVVSGRWELCSAPNFGGDCKVVTADTPQLKVYNLNDRVSSIRKLR
jgi:hypothetical protein